jgi:hypothetical protein
MASNVFAAPALSGEPAKGLEKFYAVIGKVIYSVAVPENEGGSPTLKKIAVRGTGKVLKIDKVLEDEPICCGNFVGLSKIGLIIYKKGSPRGSPERPPRPEEVYTFTWEIVTPPPVALFLDLWEAIKCLGCRDPEFSDPRWAQYTNKVLETIGEGHPVFVASKLKGLSF